MAYLDSVTAEQVKTILVSWYGEYNLRGTNMNEEVLLLVAEALYQARGCSASMKWVPLGGNPVAAGGALITAAVGYAKTIVSNAVGMQTYSMSCVKVIAEKYKERILYAGAE